MKLFVYSVIVIVAVFFSYHLGYGIGAEDGFQEGYLEIESSLDNYTACIDDLNNIINTTAFDLEYGNYSSALNNVSGNPTPYSCL